ncbi:MAG: hypothetical protein VKO44_10645 [Cyanobacteriota bacterium]|nr:hypothetical protein [Cyanobacteriota bacterium]
MGPSSRGRSRSQASEEEDLFDSQSSKRFRLRFRQVLLWGSLALCLIFLVRVLVFFLQADLMNPAWQAGFIDVLVNQGVLPFLAFVMVHLAALMEGRGGPTRRGLRLIRRLAVIPVAGYVLLVPLQLFSSVRELSGARIAKQDQLLQSTRLSSYRDAIQKATSPQDLNLRFQSLKAPALSDEQLAMGLPELRRELLKDNTLAQAQVSRQLAAADSQLTPLSVLISRMGAALGWALAFASGTVTWGSRKTVVQRLRRH